MEREDKKIGFLGGTFDPFHMGHLNLALEVLEKTSLENILICPTNISPFKTETPPIDIKHRINMIECGIEEIPQLSINESEAFNTKPSYTWDTLNDLANQHKISPLNLHLIISDDLLMSLHQWHKINEILEKFSIIVATREPAGVEPEKLNQNIYRQIKNCFLPIRSMNISSSEIRKRLKNKLYCRHLLPSKTLDYIYNYKLYS